MAMRKLGRGEMCLTPESYTRCVIVSICSAIQKSCASRFIGHSRGDVVISSLCGRITTLLTCLVHDFREGRETFSTIAAALKQCAVRLD
jgi:hypothetical protein